MSKELLERLARTPWHLAQIIPLPRSGWVAEIRHDDAQLALAYVKPTRELALEAAVTAAEERGRRGPEVGLE